MSATTSVNRKISNPFSEANAMAAAERVLQNVELLENILTQLFPASVFEDAYQTALQKLFVVQRVSNFWKGVISGSIKLQRLMLLLPPPDSFGPIPTSSVIRKIAQVCAGHIELTLLQRDDALQHTKSSASRSSLPR